MRQRLISFFTAVFFLVLIASQSHVLRLLFLLLGLFVLALSAYNFRLLKQKNLLSFWLLLRIPLFMLAVLSLFFVLPNFFWKGIFLLFAATLLFFLEAALHVIYEQLNFLWTLLSYFGVM